MTSRSGRSRWYTPCLDALERRQCLSVTIQANGPELRIDGNDAADTVSITDNGQGGVAVTANGRTTAFTGISQIVVQTRGGDDTVGGGDTDVRGDQELLERVDRVDVNRA